MTAADVAPERRMSNAEMRREIARLLERIADLEDQLAGAHFTIGQQQREFSTWKLRQGRPTVEPARPVRDVGEGL